MTMLQCPATMHMHMSNAGIASQPKRGFLVTLPARTSAGARKKARAPTPGHAAVGDDAPPQPSIQKKKKKKRKERSAGWGLELSVAEGASPEERGVRPISLSQLPRGAPRAPERT